MLVCSGREKALKGISMQNLAILDIQEVGVASGLNIAVDRELEGRIAAIGPDHEVDSRMDGCSFEQCIRDEHGTRSGGHIHSPCPDGG